MQIFSFGSSINNFLKRFDAYPKVVGIDDYQTRTYTGAIVSVVAFSLMGCLFVMELLDFLTPKIEEDLFVDISRGNKLKIRLDVVFPRIPCNLLSIDALDVAGDQHTNIKHNIYKARLDKAGLPIDTPQKSQKIGSNKKPDDTKKEDDEECPSCYGAESETIKCCFTCNDVMKAYREKRWSVHDVSKFKQCVVLSGLQGKMAEEGCQVYGYLEVNRVAGSFHIAPGESLDIGHMHVHSLDTFNPDDFDLSHLIRFLSFGDSVPEAGRNGLDGLRYAAEKSSRKIEYYLKIVSIMYEKKDGSTHSSYRYSVTQNEKIIKPESGSVPGVFFKYELSPLMVKYTEKSRSLGHFLTGVCAILGGIYTVASLIDAFLYRSIRAFQQKVEIGKVG